jgi:hypothetical protein
MKSKNLIITFLWTFVFLAIIIISLEGFGMSFAGYVVFFFIGLSSTLAVEAIIPEKARAENELLSELHKINAVLEELRPES